jgi:beta-lactam-binding protein with PASTA domain
MEQCTFVDFMQALKPWLNDDYIQHARVDEKGNFTLTFVNGGQKSYQVEDCTTGQFKDAIELLKKNDVRVFE